MSLWCTPIEYRSAWRQWLSQDDLLLVLLATPLLLFPRAQLPWIALGLLVLSLILRGLAAGRWWLRTPLDLPIAIIFLMTLVSLYPSVDLSLSLPKFYGLILGLFLVYAVASNVSTERQFWIGLGLVVSAIVPVAVLGLIGAQLNPAKLPLLSQVYGLAPKLVTGLPNSFGVATLFNPNEVGGTLAFLLPVPLALLFGARLLLRYRILLVVALLTGLAVFALAASRSAFGAFAVALLVLFIWRWRRVGLVLLAAALIAFGVALALDAQSVSEALLKVDVINAASGARALPSRLEIWDRALYMVEDFPFTGIGLNTFPVVLDTLYPSFLAGPMARIPHAHNIFLQTAVDLGLGGFLGFLGLWASLFYAGCKGYRRAGVREELPKSLYCHSKRSKESPEPAEAVAETQHAASLRTGSAATSSAAGDPRDGTTTVACSHYSEESPVHCHPERSEESSPSTEILHFVQNDNTSPQSDNPSLQKENSSPQNDSASHQNDNVSPGLSRFCNTPYATLRAVPVGPNEKADSKELPGRTAMQAALVGLLLGLGSYLFFGLTDAITLGAKPTVVLWLMIGLVVAGTQGARVRGRGSRNDHRPSAIAAPDSRFPIPHSPFPVLSFLLTTLRDLYWIVAFFLVALGYLVVGLGISGWAP